jgi:hypothetical protein
MWGDSAVANCGSHLVITVHGIRTFGQWQERLERLVRSQAGSENIEFSHYKIDYFSLLAFLTPPFRWLVVHRFRSELQLLALQEPRSRIDLIGHSFGTHVIGWALWGLREATDINVNTVILAGSVLRSGFNWSRLIGVRVQRVVNDCGTRDRILLLSQFFVLFTGMAGRTGFSGMTNRNFRNRFSAFGHSGYFKDSSGKPSDVYMLANWVPLLTTSMPVSHLSELNEGGAINGVVHWMSNNAEPIKISVYVLPLVALILWIVGQRDIAVEQTTLARQNAARAEANAKLASDNEKEAKQNEATAKDNEQTAERRLVAVEENRSRFVASTAKVVLPSDPARAMALALGALPDDLSHPDKPVVHEAISVAYEAARSERMVGILGEDSFQAY